MTRGLDEFVEVDLAAVERVAAALDLGDVEDVVDDREQMTGGIMDERRVLDDFVGRQRAALVLGQKLGEADDGVERRPSSWLMLAMNSDFTLLASSASMRAECSATRARWRRTASPRSEEYSLISEFDLVSEGPVQHLIRPLAVQII